MRRTTYIALTCAVTGRELEFDAWYDERHIADVSKIPGIVSARRFHLEWQKSNDFEAPEWRSMAMYEIESDDPQSVLAQIRAVSGTEMMPLSDAMTKVGMLQFLANPAKPAEA